MIRSARSVFCQPAFTEDEVARIFAAAGGQTLHFAKMGTVPRSAQGAVQSPFSALLAYARGEEWKAGLTVSVRRFYQVLAAVRKEFCRERVLAFQQEGLSLRQLARLYERSVPTVQAKIEERGVRTEE
ncbi:MAG TPA: hypothetical protein VMW87_15680 [Spirochaetia bacterium]|nr:hypothetical protein [Spirochaetia bacterium]